MIFIYALFHQGSCNNHPFTWLLPKWGWVTWPTSRNGGRRAYWIYKIWQIFTYHDKYSHGEKVSVKKMCHFHSVCTFLPFMSASEIIGKTPSVNKSVSDKSLKRSVIIMMIKRVHSLHQIFRGCMYPPISHCESSLIIAVLFICTSFISGVSICVPNGHGNSLSYMLVKSILM